MARIRNETIGFVFQSFHLLGDRDALENVSLPLEYRRSAAPEVSPTQVLERVGLADRITHRPSQLSGGERQRVAIARALVKEPGLLLCDEPTGNLDSASGDQVLSLLSDLRDELNTTLVLVTHDVEVAARADRVLSMKDGRWS
jgi:putative ABC transport system ATP-binding protein